MYQKITLDANFPYGIDANYLNLVTPSAMLRSYAATDYGRGNTNHNLSISLELDLGGNPVSNQTLFTTYPEKPQDAADNEILLYLGQLTGIDSIK